MALLQEDIYNYTLKGLGLNFVHVCMYIAL